MKKLLFSFAFLLAALALTACGSSKDEEPTNVGSLIGTWSNDLVDDEIINEAYSDMYKSMTDLYQFKQDGTWVWVSAFVYSDEWAEMLGKSVDIDITRGTYRVSGDKVFLTYTEVSDKESQVWIGKTLTYTYKFVGSKLQLTSTEGIIYSGTLTKVSDKDIEKYLH